MDVDTCTDAGSWLFDDGNATIRPPLAPDDNTNRPSVNGFKFGDCFVEIDGKRFRLYSVARSHDPQALIEREYEPVTFPTGWSGTFAISSDGNERLSEWLDKITKEALRTVVGPAPDRPRNRRAQWLQNPLERFAR